MFNFDSRTQLHTEQGSSTNAPGVPSPFFPGILLSNKMTKTLGKQRSGFEKSDGWKEWSRNQTLETRLFLSLLFVPSESLAPLAASSKVGTKLLPCQPAAIWSGLKGQAARPEATYLGCFFFLPPSWVKSRAVLVDGGNPAPKKPGNGDFSVNTNMQWFQPWFLRWCEWIFSIHILDRRAPRSDPVLLKLR